MAVKWHEVYGAVISSTYMAMSRGTMDIKGAKEGIKRLLMETTETGEKPWQRFVIKAGDGSVLEDTTDNPLANFREFIESKPLRGLGQSVHDVERLLSDDADALVALRNELAGSRGAQFGNSNNEKHEKSNNDNIIIRQDVDMFTEPPEPPKRERKSQGTSKSYTLSRLKKDKPELFDRVKAGELSANAAAQQAGYRKPTRSIPIDSPESAIKALTRVFTVDELVRAIGEIADGGAN